jgi:hypothetical protein
LFAPVINAMDVMLMSLAEPAAGQERPGDRGTRSTSLATA